MAEERHTAASEGVSEEELDRLDEIGRKVVKVAASTVIAGSLVGALAEPPNTDMMSLPEPTPIIQLYQAMDEDAIPDEDEDEEETPSRWRRLLRVLKYLMVALVLAGTLLFGVLKGCAGITGALMLPGDDEREEQTQTQGQTQTEDERGVAY